MEFGESTENRFSLSVFSSSYYCSNLSISFLPLLPIQHIFNHPFLAHSLHLSAFTGWFPSSLLFVTIHYFHSVTDCPFLCCLPSDCVNAFALVVRPPTEQENLLFSFQLAGEETVKSTWLRTLCRQVANTICKADAVSSATHTKESRQFDRWTGEGSCVMGSFLVWARCCEDN